MYRSRDEEGNEVKFPEVLDYARKKGYSKLLHLPMGK